MATIAWNVSFFYLVGNLDFFHRNDGISGIPAITLAGIDFGDTRNFYFLVLTCVVLAILLTRNLLNSRPGRAVRALRGGALAAESFGVNTFQARILAFVYAGVLAGLSGWLYAHLQRAVNPPLRHQHEHRLPADGRGRRGAQYRRRLPGRRHRHAAAGPVADAAAFPAACPGQFRDHRLRRPADPAAAILATRHLAAPGQAGQPPVAAGREAALARDQRGTGAAAAPAAGAWRRDPARHRAAQAVRRAGGGE
ncbi:branched-chain amino acid ABC transporter permease [Pseudoroseomonas wenyumeiae]